MDSLASILVQEINRDDSSSEPVSKIGNIFLPWRRLDHLFWCDYPVTAELSAADFLLCCPVLADIAGATVGGGSTGNYLWGVLFAAGIAVGRARTCETFVNSSQVNNRWIPLCGLDSC